VNRAINRAMVVQALDLLDVKKEHRVLDLFCGLGNFTLPLARRAREAVGVEGSTAMVERGSENALANKVDNARFHAADLTRDLADQSWTIGGFDRVLIDPPRAGALEVLPLLAGFSAERLVYVSCNPATLARDAGELQKHGYCLEAAGVMDMFPHTTHVESMALFVRR
jgi:23S rRNA (uracil1939-C5)-methyltransferase